VPEFSGLVILSVLMLIAAGMLALSERKTKKSRQ
jgi:hypothetical protein